MPQTMDNITQEIKKVELKINNVRKDLKSAKKKVADYKKTIKKEKQSKNKLETKLVATEQERDRILAEYNAICSKVEAYKEFCEQLNIDETLVAEDAIKQAEDLLFS